MVIPLNRYTYYSKYLWPAPLTLVLLNCGGTWRNLITCFSRPLDATAVAEAHYGTPENWVIWGSENIHSLLGQ